MKNTTRLNSPHQKTALIIFAREPKDGRAKTRLAKDLPVPSVTELYKAFILDVLSIAEKVPCDERFIYYAGNGSSTPFFKKHKNSFRLKRQTGANLGERMYRAFAHCKKNQFDKIVIIGTDCLTLTPRDIKTAFDELESHDCVLGPSKDGGYYLIALNELHKEFFQEIDWGTSVVFRKTLQKARKLKKTVYLLQQREDIDRFAQLKKFSRNIQNVNTAPHTQKALQWINVCKCLADREAWG
jgi:rSAM/selenodomain-associated transferase 1